MSIYEKIYIRMDSGKGFVEFKTAAVLEINLKGGLSTTEDEINAIELVKEVAVEGEKRPLDLTKLETRGTEGYTSLYDALAAQREKLARETQERELNRFRPTGLNDEEAAFLEEAAERDEERLRSAEEQTITDRRAFEDSKVLALEARAREEEEDRLRRAQVAAKWGLVESRRGGDGVGVKRPRVGARDIAEEGSSKHLTGGVDAGGIGSGEDRESSPTSTSSNMIAAAIGGKRSPSKCMTEVEAAFAGGEGGAIDLEKGNSKSDSNSKHSNAAVWKRKVLKGPLPPPPFAKQGSGVPAATKISPPAQKTAPSIAQAGLVDYDDDSEESRN